MRKWITNTGKFQVQETFAALTAGQPHRRLVQGEPMALSQESAASLKRMDIVGIYEVEPEEFGFV